VSFGSLILVVGVLTILIQKGVIQWKKCMKDSKTLPPELVSLREFGICKMKIICVYYSKNSQQMKKTSINLLWLVLTQISTSVTKVFVDLKKCLHFFWEI